MDLNALERLWTEAQLPPDVGPGPAMRWANQRRSELAAERAAHLEAIKAQRSAVVAALVDGQLDFAAATTELTRLRAEVVTASKGSDSIFAVARTRIEAMALEQLRLGWDQVQPVAIEIHDAAVARLTKLADDLAGVADAKAASSAGPKPASKFSEAAALIAQLDRLHRLRDKISSELGLRPVTDEQTGDRRWRYPERLRTWRKTDPARPASDVARFLAQIAAGAEPIYGTDDDVAATIARRHEANPPPPRVVGNQGGRRRLGRGARDRTHYGDLPLGVQV